MECLLVNMRKAIKSVTKLSLFVHHIAQFQVCSADADMQGAGQRSSEDVNINTSPPGLKVVVGSVFTMLAAAVPNLHELRLDGSCWDAALSSFGICCSQLTSLDVSIPAVPVEALCDFGTYLPGLLSVSVGSKSANYVDAKKISTYMDDFLPMTGQCLYLSNLVIHFNVDFRLSCKPDAWACVPAGLKHLTCNCRVGDGQLSFDQLIRRLPSLSLGDILWDLSQVPQQFPLLQRLQMMTNHLSLSCSSELVDEDGALNLDVLKQRFLSGNFSLTCLGLHISGDCEDIHNVLTWLPPIPASVHLYLTLTGEGPPLFLQHIHRLFPNTEAITMWGCWAPSEVWEMEVLRPLATLSELYRLELTSPQLTLTTAGLIQVCDWLAPCFQFLILNSGACQNVNVGALEAEVKKLGKEIHVHLIH